MNPFGLATKIVLTTALAAGAFTLVGARLIPKPSDLMASAVHFRKAFDEFRKGCSAAVFGATAGMPGDAKKQNEANRIHID